MTRGQAQRECDRRNRPREVASHNIVNIDAAAFWRGCGLNRNFLINGGSEGQRANALVEMLVDFRSRSADAVIVLTGSDLTERAIVQAAREKRLPKTLVSSSTYRNYHALYRMELENMSELLMFVARQSGYGELDKLENYIKAFIAVSNRYYPPSLASLITLDKKYPQNSQILQLAKLAGVSREHVRAIESDPTATGKLRNILNRLLAAYKYISAPNCNSKFNLLTGTNAGAVMCIKVNSDNPDVLDMALAMELKQLMAANRRFLLVLNDMSLRNAEGLFRQVVEAKSASSNTCVGICVRNAGAWAATIHGVQNAQDSMLKNTQNFLMFNDNSDADSDLDDILKYLGQFPKYEVTMGGGHGAELIPILHHAEWTVACVGMRNRVAPEDLRGYGVLVKGHDSRRIHLHRSLQIRSAQTLE